MELPIDSISLNDTINAASLTIYRKNSLNASKYQMGTPQELLMIPKSELGSFFEEQKVPDNLTSYYTTLSNNQYTYSNITNLVNTLRRQRRDNPDYDKDPDWNKVVLVPITRVTQTTSNNTVITVRVLHDLSLNFAKLKNCLLYTSPSPRDGLLSRMPSSA